MRTRVKVGLLLLFIGFLLYVLFIHNFNYYTLIHFTSKALIVLGLILMMGTIQLDEKIPRSFFLNPKRWTLNTLRLIGVMVVAVVLGIALLQLGSHLNRLWLSSRINKTPIEKVGKIEGVAFREEISMKILGQSPQAFLVVSINHRGEYHRAYIRIEKPQPFEFRERVWVRFLDGNPELMIIDERNAR